MDDTARARTARRHRRPLPFELVALVLQGGGSLGAYQGGVYQALAEARIHPDWTAGISIGAINAALIAGNRPETRVDRLREFWETVTQRLPAASGTTIGLSAAAELVPGDVQRRSFLNQVSAGSAIATGVHGFFAPRVPGPWLWPSGTLEATSWYDTAALRATLESLIDFDRINAGEMRLSVGAVNIRTGNFTYFDTTERTISVEHVMASGALPPGLPAVEIEGEFFWDGGLVSNSPLQWVSDGLAHRSALAFQVDLWSARGRFPRNLVEVMTRIKEIRYSSRTRLMSDRTQQRQRVRNAIASLMAKLPAELKASPEIEILREVAERRTINLVQLIYRPKGYEGVSKDFEFSRQSMEEHWRAGYDDTVRSLRDPDVLECPDTVEGIRTFDIAGERIG
jgi:NTE family protein